MGNSLRPFSFLSFAVSHALGGYDVGGWHALHLAIHAAAALTLFGVARRTLRLPRIGLDDAAATGTACAIALLWAVHPLNSQAVLYLVQRMECLAGLSALLVLAGLLRSVDAASAAAARGWQAAAVVAFYAGLGCKEVVVTVPFALYLFDAALVSGSFAGPLRARPALYGSLFAPFLVVPLLWWAVAPWRFATLRPTPDTLPPLEYLWAQGAVIVRYLATFLWPAELNFDHAWDPSQHRAAIPVSAAAVVLLLAATVAAVRRRSPLGWLGAAFFLALAPTSSFHPVADLLVEHRMYLASAACVAFVVLGGRALLVRATAPGPARRAVAAAGVAVAAIPLGGATFARSAVYDTAERLWSDVAAKAPHNARAHYNLGVALHESGRPEDEVRALSCFLRAAELDPAHVRALNNAGSIQFRRGRLEEAAALLGAAAARDDAPFDVLRNHASALLALGRHDETVATLRRAADLLPDGAQADPHRARLRNDVGVCLSRSGDRTRAAEEFEHAVRLDPSFAAARENLVGALEAAGRHAEAEEHLRRLCDAEPRSCVPRLRLARALAAGGKVPAAIDAYLAAIAIDPAAVEARVELAGLCIAEPNRSAASAHLAATLRREPSNAEASRALELVRRAR